MRRAVGSGVRSPGKGCSAARCRDNQLQPRDSAYVLSTQHHYRVHLMKGWDWSKFKGSQACLKWARRNLEALEKTLPLVSARKACVQAGGNLGIFPKWLAQYFEIVYTFEPEQELHKLLKLNAPENNILCMNAALGDTTEPVRMACTRRDDSGRAVHEGLTHVAGPGNVPCLRLDDLRLNECNLLYLDIEGWEYRALIGARETIDRCRPVIGVEINKNISYTGRSGDELRKLIISHGYQLALTVQSDEIYTPAF